MPLCSAAREGEKLGMRLYQRVHTRAGISTVARPWIRGRVSHHARIHRIQLDVPVTRNHVARRLGEKGAIAPLPQCASASVMAVEVLNIALSEIAHESNARVR